jgi:hypothetical protein
MAHERPITSDDVASAADELRSAFASDADREVLHLAGSELRLERTSPVEFTVRAEHSSAVTRVILSVEDRPDSYPAELPFLPDEIVMVSVNDGEVMAVWWSRSDPADLLAEIDRQCLDAGWNRESGPPIPDSTIIRHTFEKGNAVRYTTAGQGLVSVIEKPNRSRT